METHNCSICLDDILATTGSATLSCGHYFHIGCLGRWLMKNESCPYCRHEANEKEKIAEDQESDSESEYEGDEEDEEDNNDYAEPFVWRRVGPGHWVTVEIVKAIPEYNEEEHAFWVFRKTMEMIENNETIQAVPEVTQLTKENRVIRLRDRLNAFAVLQRDDGYESF